MIVLQNLYLGQTIKKKGYHLRYGSIGIQDTETGEIFRRRLTDITYFEGYLILSW